MLSKPGGRAACWHGCKLPLADITLHAQLFTLAVGMIVPKTKDGRVVFMLPWLDQTIAGTTDSSTEITMRPQVNASTGCWCVFAPGWRLCEAGPSHCRDDRLDHEITMRPQLKDRHVLGLAGWHSCPAGTVGPPCPGPAIPHRLCSCCLHTLLCATANEATPSPCFPTAAHGGGDSVHPGCDCRLPGGQGVMDLLAAACIMLHYTSVDVHCMPCERALHATRQRDSYCSLPVRFAVPQ